MNSKEKTSYRSKKEWKEFREKMLKLRGLKCELTGVKLHAKTAQVHHLRPDLYNQLDPELFKVLSPSAHDFVEFMAPILAGRTTEVPNREAWMALLGDFLPHSERTVDALMAQMRPAE